MRTLFVLFLLWSTPSWAQVQKDFEFNFLIITRQSIDPSSLNRHIEGVNNDAGTTEDLSKISGSSFFSAEGIYIPNNELAYGIRYTSMSGSTSSGTASGARREFTPRLTDISAVVKLQTEPKKFQAGVGATLGVSAPFSISSTSGGTTTSYTATNQIVWRGFVTGRFNFGKFALLGELGYLWAKAPELKDGDTRLTASNGTAVELDMSSGYLGIGVGFQF